MNLNNVEKPSRYAGGELNSIYKENAQVNFALCFPDVYEIGMSYLGYQILYEVLNDLDYVYAQRVYLPWTDMADQMKNSGEVLSSLETKIPLCDFDVVSINLSYEMCYSNVLNLLDLGNIPLKSIDRKNGDPIILGGGACAVNPEPLAAFFDVFSIGEGEEALREFSQLYKIHKEKGFDRFEFLKEAANIEGIYVPMFYTPVYDDDGKFLKMDISENAPEKIKRRIVLNFNGERTVQKPVVPYLNIVHDRCTLEIMRGCINGCRFCQAGYATRPVRERNYSAVLDNAKNIIDNTGYDEISLCSLSSSDYTEIGTLINSLIDEFEDKKVSVSLPSLRSGKFEIAEQLQKVRSTGLTFAPEAGTQRLRDVINKNITEDEILETARRAFLSGAHTIKLYFMIGLPTETYDDLDGIVDLVKKIREQYYYIDKDKRAGRLSITVSASCFVPKPCTAFQWEAQEDIETLKAKQKYLKEKLKMKNVTFRYHDAELSNIEAVFARGDRRLSEVLLHAYKNGARFDAWQDHFSYERYLQAFDTCGVDKENYTSAQPKDMPLCNSHIDSGLNDGFFRREADKAYKAETTPDCRSKCSGCGMQAVCTLNKGTVL